MLTGLQSWQFSHDCQILNTSGNVCLGKIAKGQLPNAEEHFQLH